MFSNHTSLFLSLSLVIAGSTTGAHAGSLAPDAVDTSKFAKKFELKDYVGKSHLEMMQDISKALDEISDGGKLVDSYDENLAKGLGASIKVNDDTYIFHIGYKKGEPKSGRSYALAKNAESIGDWSDHKYLDNLWDTVTKADEDELRAFYSTLIQVLGNSDASGYKKIQKDSDQLVETEFLAIYGAEQDRHRMSGLGKSFDWDTALFQVTLLGAFHAGQKEFAKFYEEDFSKKSYDQKLCVYDDKEAKKQTKKKNKDGLEKRKAEFYDYWQFGDTAELDEKGECSGRSGIHITEDDYDAMGKWITKYYDKKGRGSKGADAIKRIEKLIEGDGKNVIDDLSRFFVHKGDEHKHMTDLTEKLADAVADLVVHMRKDADEISEYTNNKSDD